MISSKKCMVSADCCSYNKNNHRRYEQRIQKETGRIFSGNQTETSYTSRKEDAV